MGIRDYPTNSHLLMQHVALLCLKIQGELNFKLDTRQVSTWLADSFLLLNEVFLNTSTSPFRSVLSTSSAPHLRFAVSSARINKASRTTSKVIGIATRKANGISWFGSNRAGYLFSSWSAEGDGPANNAEERFIMLKFLFKLVEMNMSPKVFVLLRRKVPMSQNMHVYKAAPLTLRGFTCNKMIKRLTTLFKHVGRFPFNPKFRKFRLVHQMERTISV